MRHIFVGITFFMCIMMQAEDELNNVIDALDGWRICSNYLQSKNNADIVDVCANYSIKVVQLKNNQNITVGDNQSISMLHGFGVVLAVLDVIHMLKTYKQHKNWIGSMSYEEFTIRFPHLLQAEYHILRIQKILQMSSLGTFPEKIMARIYLAQSSLFQPYCNIMNDCAQRFILKSFDKNYNFVWREKDDAAQAYKKFYKRVPQHWRTLAYYADKLPDEFAKEYHAEWRCKINNEYNQTLLEMIYAGINKNFPLLKRLCRKYYDELSKKLYRYYINQQAEHMKYECDEFIDEADHQENAVTNSVEDKQEAIVLHDFYQQELSQWLLVEENDVMSDKDHKTIIDLPLHPHYRFVLLRNFIEKVCHGIDTSEEIFDEFFETSGILKKYKNHALVKKYLDGKLLEDSVIHKAVNFAVAIIQKEHDETTYRLSQTIMEYVARFFAFQEDDVAYKKCKQIIAALYDVLSYRKYD